MGSIFQHLVLLLLVGIFALAYMFTSVIRPAFPTQTRSQSGTLKSHYSSLCLLSLLSDPATARSPAYVSPHQGHVLHPNLCLFDCRRPPHGKPWAFRKVWLPFSFAVSYPHYYHRHQKRSSELHATRMLLLNARCGDVEYGRYVFRWRDA
jgi:hypothetical protein